MNWDWSVLETKMVATARRRLPQPGASVRQTAKYVTVGAMGTLIDVVLFMLLRIRFGISDLLANTAAYGAGTVNNFIVHRRWTFAGQRQQRKAVGVQFAKFVAVNLTALAVNNLLLVLLEPTFDTLFDASEFGEMLAKGLAMTAGMCLSFALQRAWTFRTTHDALGVEPSRVPVHHPQPHQHRHANRRAVGTAVLAVQALAHTPR